MILDHGHLGELRALIPPKVHMIALTATATKSSREKIMRSLHMINPVVVNLSPHKKNVVYTVHPKPQLEEFVASIAGVLKSCRVNIPRAIIFCQHYVESA